MCVKNHEGEHKCCCCCSLRGAKITFIVLQSLGAIGAAATGQWVSMSFALSFLVVAIMTLIKNHSSSVQKFGYWFTLIWAIGTLASFLAIVIMGFMGVSAACEIGLDPLDPASVEASDLCKSAALPMWAAYAAIYGFIAVPINICLVQVFYYSW